MGGLDHKDVYMCHILARLWAAVVAPLAGLLSFVADVIAL